MYFIELWMEASALKNNIVNIYVYYIILSLVFSGRFYEF